MYEYLMWVALLGIIWIVAYISKPELRKKMRWSSWIAFPFGLGELYFIPNYWTPQTLFDLGIKYHFDIEAFLLMFFLGGIAAFIYEGLFKKKISKVQKFCQPLCRCYTPFISSLVAFIILIKLLSEWNIIYPASFACLIGGITAMFIYPRLRKHVVLGGVLFAVLYWVSLTLIELISPGWIATTWNMTALSSITLIHVPIEEIFFGFSFGTLWTPLFEEICSNLHVKRGEKWSKKN